MELGVTGSLSGIGELRKLFEVNRWTVTPFTGPAARPSDETWICEVGIPGARLGALVEAQIKLHRICRNAPVQVDIRVIERIPTDPPQRQRGIVHAAPHGPLGGGALGRLLTTIGYFDVGREVFTEPGPDPLAEAASLAGRQLDPRVTPPPHTNVRGISAQSHDTSGRQTLIPRHLQLPFLLAAAMLLFVLGITLGSLDSSVITWLTVAGPTVLLLGLPAGAVIAEGNARSTNVDYRRGLFVAWPVSCLPLFAGAALGWSAPSRQALPVTLVLGAVLMTVNGFRLLFRGLGWRATLAWLVPTLFPLLILLLPLPGLILQVMYLDRFDLSREDVFVPTIWLGAAGVKAWIFAAVPSVVASLVGYARHLHAFSTFGGAIIGLGIVSVALMVTITSLWTQVAIPAYRAADRAAVAAHKGEQPDPYFGIAPKLSCPRPLSTDPAPLQGTAIDLTRPYLYFPSSGDWVRLWQPESETLTTIRKEDFQLVPANGPLCRADD
ncbi:hypothetical protein ACIRBX_18305 [Kitasatospora sp. NPDC096147]|uniref:hypothetical protein n=1 Tax=Kitasatospora sp. NPDC096147 TaxID=3364093 RepID=UPI0037F3BFFD